MDRSAHPMRHPKGAKGQLDPVDVSPQTLSEIAAQLARKANRGLSRASRERRGFMLNRIFEFYGSATRLDSINNEDVRKFVQHRLRRAAPGSITLELNLLKKIFELGIETGAVGHNPVVGVKTPSRPRATPRFLTREEFRIILEASADWLRPILETSVAIGLTQAELLTLRFKDITEKNGQMMSVDIRRGRQVRKIPLNRMARAVFEQIRHDSPNGNALVFEGESINTKNISQAFRRTCRRSLGVQNFAFKDLRYSAAKWMLDSGARLEDIASYLGHRSLRMTERVILPQAGPPAVDLGAIDW
jgi:integrase